MELNELFNKLQQEAQAELKKISHSHEVENFKNVYLGRKGKLAELMKSLKDVSAEQKPELGRVANEVKQFLERGVDELMNAVGVTEDKSKILDITLPATPPTCGHLHPLTQVTNEVVSVFNRLGFIVAEGPDIESEFFCFESLNIPDTHPARDTQDTFFVADHEKTVMKTHTSAMQVRSMLTHGVPLRAIFPGRCFRYDATDASHDTTFYQLEGIMVDKNISIANVQYAMKLMLKEVLKKDVKLRMRPGYFPFVEPGFELDVTCWVCNGSGCSVCKQSGWVELLPCGMIHPNVLRAANVDPSEYSGFAFGLGLTRLTMMKYGIDDIRLLQSGDLRFLNQF
jgi:phenylalanyl-tRNA synthetase alpha chain